MPLVSSSCCHSSSSTTSWSLLLTFRGMNSDQLQILKSFFYFSSSGVLSCTRHSTLSSTTSLRSSSPCPLHTEWHASGTTLSSWSISTRGEYCGPGDQLQLTSTQIISGTCTPWTRPGWTRADPWWTRRRRPMSARRRTKRRSKNRALARFFAFTNLGHNIDTYVMSCARL